MVSVTIEFVIVTKRIGNNRKENEYKPEDEKFVDNSKICADEQFFYARKILSI